MRKKDIITLLTTTILLIARPTAQAQTMGSWRNYLSYQHITEASGNTERTYVLASGNLFSYDHEDNTVTTYDKINGLHGADISHIGYSNKTRSLIIVYSDQLIDILEADGNITAIPDFRDKIMPQDKSVNAIDIHGADAYLSTPFGIVRVDMDRAVIAETYMLEMNVSGVRIEGGRIFAESNGAGEWSAPLTANLNDPSKWTRTGEYRPIDRTINPTLKAELEKIKPNSPASDKAGSLKFQDGYLYLVPGYSNRIPIEGSVSLYDGNRWRNASTSLTTKYGGRVHGFESIAVTQEDPLHYFVGATSGIFEFKDTTLIALHDRNNSPLLPALTVTAPSYDFYTLALGLALDNEGKLYAFNSIAPPTNEIVTFDLKDRKWDVIGTGTFSDITYKGDLSTWQEVKEMIFDRDGHLWAANDFWTKPGFLYYDPATKTAKAYNKLANQDGKTVDFNYGRCIMQDREGNIWMGTNVGPVYLPAQQIGTDDATVIQVKIPRNDGSNLADYLLSNTDILSMAIDGAGRKWFGTNGNGVYLISADNLTQIQHFTAANSPLLGDAVESIAINDETGEVFFGTGNGLCSYISDATAGSETKMDPSSVTAYPNPVRPDFEGPVTIRGLAWGSDIKITDTAGTLIRSGRSNGGTFTWDLKDRSGRRVASGIYFVIATSETDKSNHVACKIAVIN